MSVLARLFGRAAPRIAAALPRDAAALAALHGVSFNRGWGEQEFEQLLTDRNVVADRMAAGRKTIGFILSRRAAEEAEILSVAVAPAFRGRGHSRALIDLHMRRLAGLGVRALFLEVDEGNIPARALYAGAGFREVGRRPGYYAKDAAARASALVLRRDF
jgi:ribosomal-protein-alanine N-acetyltransferase